ncbi:MAG: hypothetical protein AUG51_07280 [Acidobacteria bacterium 13_1_20CM_3_53_8]|nr:MAG: hypothetical protein AUG51_07280 [Acidobacteria bacterium 13_1_20CM_3_53_8]
MIVHEAPRWSWRQRADLLRRLIQGKRSGPAYVGVGVLVIVLLGGTAASRVDVKGPAVEWMLAHGYEWQLNDRMSFEILHLPFDWARGLLSPGIPRLYMDISFENLQVLQAQRAQALQRGVLIHGEDDEVSAKLRIGSRSVRIKVRLKGDTPVHFEGGRRSFLVKVKGGDAVMGMRSFALQHPMTRDYQTEPLFLEAVRRHGLLAPRYEFVDLYINGDFEGRLALEEHFSKELLESQGRRESVIIRLDESNFWRLREQNMPRDMAGDYDFVPIDAFQDSVVARSPVLSQQRENAVRLLDAFRRGVLKPSQVFDPDALGGMIAIAEAWSAVHALDWRNVRFYYNPVTARLEPIAYDGKVLIEQLTPERIVDNRAAFTRALLADSAVERAHRQMLHQLADSPRERALTDSLNDRQNEILAVLRRHYPLLRPLPLNDVAVRARGILAREVAGEPDRFRDWKPEHLLWAQYVQPSKAGSEAYMEVASRIPEALSILSVAWKSASNGTFTDATGGNRAMPVDLKPMAPVDDARPWWWTRTSALKRPLSSPPERVHVPLVPPPADPGVQLVIRARRSSNGQEFTLLAPRGYEPLTQPLVPAGDVTIALAEQPFLRLNGTTLSVARGSWKVTRLLTVPAGLTLAIGAGTTLTFAPGTGIVSHGPVDFRGTREAPVVLRPTGAETTWAGLVVLTPGGESCLQHVSINGTSGFTLPGWHLPAGVTFYEAAVRLHNVAFSRNRTEDALNLVHSPFEIRDVSFADTYSDALDLDSSDGTIERLAFDNIGWLGGGDALDLSGSRVTLDGFRGTRIVDKAVDLGELSQLTARNVEVTDAGAGAVAKDGSHLFLSGARFDGVREGLMTYVKKPEYGSPGLTAIDVTIKHAQTQTVAQTGSSLVLNGKRIATQIVDVKKMYSTGAMKKARGL